MPNDTRTDVPEPEPGVALPDDDVLRELARIGGPDPLGAFVGTVAQMTEL